MSDSESDVLIHNPLLVTKNRPLYLCYFYTFVL